MLVTLFSGLKEHIINNINLSRNLHRHYTTIERVYIRVSVSGKRVVERLAILRTELEIVIHICVRMFSVK